MQEQQCCFVKKENCEDVNEQINEVIAERVILAVIPVKGKGKIGYGTIEFVFSKGLCKKCFPEIFWVEIVNVEWIIGYDIRGIVQDPWYIETIAVAEKS